MEREDDEPDSKENTELFPVYIVDKGNLHTFAITSATAIFERLKVIISSPLMFFAH